MMKLNVRTGVVENVNDDMSLTLRLNKLSRSKKEAFDLIGVFARNHKIVNNDYSLRSVEMFKEAYRFVYGDEDG